MALLAQDATARISAAIQAVEQTTDAELVTILARKEEHDHRQLKADAKHEWHRDGKADPSRNSLLSRAELGTASISRAEPAPNRQGNGCPHLCE